MSAAGLGERRRGERSRVGRRSDLISSLRLVISACSFSRSKDWGEGLTVDILGLAAVGRLGVATSMILSASLASSEIAVVVLAEARTIRTLDHRYYRLRTRDWQPASLTPINTFTPCCLIIIGFPYNYSVFV